MKNLYQVNPILCALTILLLGIFIIFYAQGYKIVENVTNSLPQKFFFTQEGVLPQKEDYVMFETDNKWYKMPFIKQVIGVAGDKIIKDEKNRFWIQSADNSNIKYAGIAKTEFVSGDNLSHQDPGIIPNGKFYVYSSHKDSLDSRYKDIGLIDHEEVIGKSTPITIAHLIAFLTVLAILSLVIKSFFQKQLTAHLSIFLIILTLSQAAQAADLGSYGQTYPISEPDLSLEIQNKLKKLEDSGELSNLQKQWQEQAKAKVKRPDPVENLSRAQKNREFHYDPAIRSNRDVYDHQGRVVIKKGTTVNPLDYHSLPQNLIFIDGDDQLQVQWAMKQNEDFSSLIILTKGNIIDLMKELKVRLYFDQKGILTGKFGIKHLPAIISQDGKLLKVKEVADL